MGAELGIRTLSRQGISFTCAFSLFLFSRGREDARGLKPSVSAKAHALPGRCREGTVPRFSEQKQPWRPGDGPPAGVLFELHCSKGIEDESEMTGTCDSLTVTPMKHTPAPGLGSSPAHSAHHTPESPRSRNPRHPFQIETETQRGPPTTRSPPRATQLGGSRTLKNPGPPGASACGWCGQLSKSTHQATGLEA